MIIQTGGPRMTWCTSGRTWTRCRSCPASTCRASRWSSTRAHTATSSPTQVHVNIFEAFSLPMCVWCNFLPNTKIFSYDPGSRVYLHSTWVKYSIYQTNINMQITKYLSIPERVYPTIAAMLLHYKQIHFPLSDWNKSLLFLQFLDLALWQANGINLT